MSIKINIYIIENFNLKQLRDKCKLYGMKGYSKHNKSALQENIKKFVASKYIQRWYRKMKAFTSICSISMEPTRYPCWPVKQEKGWIYYNLPDLVDYFLVSGNFKCPISKYIFNSKELKSMDVYVNKVGIKRKSVYSAKKNPEYYRKIKDKEEQIDILTDQIRDVVGIIIDRFSSSLETDFSECMLNLNILCFPYLQTFIKQLNRKSRDRLKHSFSTSIELIQNVTKINHRGMFMDSDCDKSFKLDERKNIVIEWLEKERNNLQLI
jgi:hypothetical protein